MFRNFINGIIIEVPSDEDVRLLRGGVRAPPGSFGVNSGADQDLGLILPQSHVPIAEILKFLIRCEKENAGIFFVLAQECGSPKLNH